MKVSDIIKDDNERKVVKIVNHLKKKKCTNPKANKTGPMTNFIDVFGGTAGTKNDNTDASTDIVQ